MPLLDSAAHTQLRVAVILLLRFRHDSRGLQQQTPVGVLTNYVSLVGVPWKYHPTSVVRFTIVVMVRI